MRIVTDVNDQRQLTICLGRNSENIVTEVAFDISSWVSEYGSGTAAILIQRPTESAAAPVLTQMDGNIAYHSLTNGDLQYVGTGEIEVTYTVGSKLKKGKIYKTKILDALSSTESAPEPWQSWVDDVLEAADEANSSAEDAEDSADSASASATSASNSASSASASATSASNSATSANNSKVAAATSETNASNSATSASNSATSASESAQSATQSKNSASASAEAAEDAKDAAEEASTHYPYVDETTGDWFNWDVDEGEFVDTGVHAKGDKGDKGDTGKGIASTVLNADYTLTITFTDGTTYTTEPIRGAKGETGNGIASTVLNADYTLTITFTNGTTYTTGSIRGEKGDTGDCNFATFEINPTTGILTASWTRETSDIVFSLNSDGNLVVTVQ